MPKLDRRVNKLRRQAASAELEAVHVWVELSLAEKALARLEELKDDGTDSATAHGFGLLRYSSAAGRDAEARRLTAKLREKLAKKRERANELDRQLREYEATRPRNISYRLHSEYHHATYSEDRLARMSASQRTRPVLVTTLGGLSWWWYLGRFWWDDQRLGASEVRSLVLERDRRTMHEGDVAEKTRAVAVGELPPVLRSADEQLPEAVRTAVWRRDEGRCVDCGTRERLIFDVIVPVARGGSRNTPNVELRCASCLPRAQQSAAVEDENADARNDAGRRRSPRLGSSPRSRATPMPSDILSDPLEKWPSG